MSLDFKKKNRSTNWDEEEKILLKRLITEKIHIIEDKNVSTNTNNNKKKAWEEIHSSFNILNCKERSLQQMQNQWRNTKSLLKSRDFAYRRACNATGGGPPPTSPPAEDAAIIELIPNEFTVDSNDFDSDSIYNKKRKTDDKPQASATLSLDLDDTPVITQPEIIYPQSINLVLPDEDKNIEISQIEMKPACTPIKKRFKKNIKSKALDYEKEIFMKTMEAKQQAMDLAHKEHEERMNILKLEKEYWALKLAQLKDKNL